MREPLRLKLIQAAVKVGAAMLVERQRVDPAIEFETAPRPLGMASGQSPQIASMSALAGEIAIAQDQALRSAIPGPDLEIAYDGAAIEN